MSRNTEAAARGPRRRALLWAAVVVLGLTASDRSLRRAQVAPPAATSGVATLTRDHIRRPLPPGTIDRYVLHLAAGDYARVVVEQHGIDVAASLFAPDGTALAATAHRQRGRILLSAIASVSGKHVLEVRPLQTLPLPGQYSVALEQSRAAGPRDREWVAANRAFNEGEALRAEWRLEASEAALAKYRAAAVHWEKASDLSRSAHALTRVGETLSLLGKPDEALSELAEVLRRARESHQPTEECAALTMTARVLVDLGTLSIATERAERAVNACREANDPSGEADARNALGETYASGGRTRESIDIYHRALQVARDALDRRGQAQALLNLGFAYSDLSEVAEARRSHENALALWASVEDRRGESATLTALGHLLVALGEHQQALEHYRAARGLAERLGDRLGLASLMNGIGTVHYRSGDPGAAASYFVHAADLFRAINHRAGEATSLAILGTCASSQGRSAEALAHYARALTLVRASSNKLLEARVLELVGHVQMDRGNLESALEQFRQSRALSRTIGYRIGEIYASGSIGEVMHRRGRHQQALDAYAEAVQLSQRAHNPVAESLMLYHMARTETTLGRLDRALALIRKSLDHVEGLRTDVASLDLRASYLASVRDRHELQIDILMRMRSGKDGRAHTILAFETSEQARARSFLDGLAQARGGIREGVAPALLAREAAIRHSLNATAQRLVQRQNGGADAAEIAALAADLDKQAAAHREIEAEIRSLSPRYASLMQPRPLTLAQVQPLLLDDRTVLLQYFTGKERSYVWALTRTALAAYALPAHHEIAARVGAYREALTALPARGQVPAVNSAGTVRSVGGLARSSPVELERTARALSEMLLAPVAPHLKNARVVVVADGILHLLPFAALPEPRIAPTATPVPLVVEHEIVNLPSASTLALLRGAWNQEGRWKKTVMVFGDPVYEADDPRIAARDPQPPAPETVIASTLRGGRISRLTETRGEARSIATLAAPSDLALDFDANRATAMSAALANYRIVHFAAHGTVDDRRPELSGIILSLFDRRGQPQDGFLRLHDIYNLKIPADLVVLSACSTALGKDVVGEGLIGLVRGFMYAGARRVVASLWEVDDEATSELMTRFYRGMLDKKLTPPAALRAAQVDLMATTKWKAPFYWAAFVLQGDWN